jgi:hypothetical protein
MTAEQLAAKIRANALKLAQTGGYSVEAEALMVIATDLADLAGKVAVLEGLARTDIGQIVDGILEGRYRPPPVNEKRTPLPLAGEDSD